MMGFFCCFGSRRKDDQQRQQLKIEDSHRVQSVESVETESVESVEKPEVNPESSPENTRTSDNIKAQTFPFQDLSNATDNFREENLIGSGGFGAVFKGQLESTGQVVAVKQLDQSGFQGEKEFLVEVLMLSLVHHPNLVKLIGYCAEADQRLLVYEYMPLGSLEDHLLIATDQEPLDWNMRMMIAAGAAKGLEYLHNEAEPPVIFRDLKSANILLGEDFHPKLSDFGLAKFGPTGDKSHVSTRVMGTHGYCAPEYAKTGKLTTKSDIFSFGVVLLELLTGRPAIDDTLGGPERMLVDWAHLRFKDRNRISLLADPLLEGGFSESIFKKVLEVAFMCINENPALRPCIRDVVSALEYLASHRYDPNKPKRVRSKGCPETAGKNSERERAVAEARLWGETLRDQRLQQHAQPNHEESHYQTFPFSITETIEVSKTGQGVQSS